MNGNVELSLGPRTHPDFPRHWGEPEGRQYSGERESWILRHIGEDLAIERRAAAAGDAVARERIEERRCRRLLAAGSNPAALLRLLQHDS